MACWVVGAPFSHDARAEYGDVDENELICEAQKALGLGVSSFDTADAYSRGRIVGEYI